MLSLLTRWKALSLLGVNIPGFPQSMVSFLGVRITDSPQTMVSYTPACWNAETLKKHECAEEPTSCTQEHMFLEREVQTMSFALGCEFATAGGNCLVCAVLTMSQNCLQVVPCTVYCCHVNIRSATCYLFRVVQCKHFDTECRVANFP